MNKVGLGISPSESWHRDLAKLIEHIRMRNFPDILNETLRHLTSFNTSLIATYKHSYKPIVVLSTHSQRLGPTLTKYINEVYILDPLFNAIQQGLGAGVHRLREIAPDSFESTEYYRSCYHEFDLVDEIILVIPLDNDVVFTISLGRKSNLGTITRAERNTLNSVFPVISALVHQFWLAQSSEYVHDEQAHNSMEHALSTFGSGVLTRREQEITGLILQGHSSKSIAQLLDISAGTVKVHRKNIHARLNTSTQSELFSMFLNHLNNLASG
ncbi:helix-turn-helix transcriptional regulator [Marinobacterium nitratireducens]|uniref:Helix-turn-helix transcriptional regulator n=1 Tax=Marinobacterium nitratireducens TaxID=518897 RepID=A0A918DST8_9GAMM|nr:helix-turn-helix transcriptional regulator [Marinobacterium nitratireducens]GGO81418.1 helix-turn-helix transcriptional regulator [Marinobacterium nitratireducens]